MGKKVCQDSATGKLAEERRSGTERRNAMSFWELFVRRPLRRKSRGRRKTDQAAYVDVYDSQTWIIAITVLILSFADAVLTKMHLVRGSAAEANPVMRMVIDHGGFPLFYIAKAVMTFFPVVVIMIHKEWALGRFAAKLCLLAYSILACYHLFLLCVT
jgi:hypothetical protein